MIFRLLRRREQAPAPAVETEELAPGTAVRPHRRDEEDGHDTLILHGEHAAGGRRAPLPTDGERLRLLMSSHVEAEEGRCVQCGICSYNCPMGIDVRSYSRRAAPVLDSRCILCGECVARCPRGVLSFHADEAGNVGARLESGV